MFVTVYTYLVTPLVIKSINTIHLNLIKVRHYNIKFQYLPEFTWYQSRKVTNVQNFSLSSILSNTSAAMASSSSTNTEHASPTSTPIIPHSLTQVHHLITIKLTRDNYLLWKAQIVPYLKGQHLFGFLDGTRLAPLPVLTSTADGAAQIIPNPEFQQWHLQDQMLLSALISSLSETILAHVVRCATARDVWQVLERMFTSQSRARTMQVHYQLATLQKGDSTVAEYYHRFTLLADTLAAVNHPLDSFELVSFFLAGLGSEYDSLVTSVQTRVDPLSIEDLYGHLLTHEIRLAHHQPAVDLSLANANFTAPTSSARGGRSGKSPAYFQSNRGPTTTNQRTNRGRGRGGRGGSSSNRPTCQVCNKPGHFALQCYHRFDSSYASEARPSMQALLATPSAPQDPNWYTDSGATHHLTADLGNLNLRADDYNGPDQIRVGNGTGLSVKHVGSTQLSHPTSPFILRDVLHVPHITKNLISVHKFTKDTNTSLDFHPYYFLVKDRVSGKVLLRGLSKNGLYIFPTSFNKRLVRPQALVGERTSVSKWHSRLGHPAFRVVSQIISRFKLPVVSNKIDSSCSACFSSKSKQLSFSLSSTQTNAPLELIYSDVWGPSPICSRNGFKYYVSFVDAFSRYTWLYPMTRKNDAFAIFQKFQKYVERFFTLKIKLVQTDWGGEYCTLSTFFENCGILHRVSCPHTHQQNGVVERKHRHIVETGLALLSHASSFSFLG